MAANNLIPQGTLNRLRPSVVVPNYPQLNVTAGFMGKQMIRLTLEGNTTLMIPTQTGNVTSPEPFQMASLMVHLLKTQNLASLWKQQIETIATVGDITVTSDTSVFPNYYLSNCAIETVSEVSFAGDDPGYIVHVTGAYYINSNLWNLT
jgi:hypothetical protein